MAALTVAGFGGEELKLAAGIERGAVALGQSGLVIPKYPTDSYHLGKKSE